MNYIQATGSSSSLYTFNDFLSSYRSAKTNIVQYNIWPLFIIIIIIIIIMTYNLFYVRKETGLLCQFTSVL